MHGLSNSGGRQLEVNGKSLYSHKANEQPLHSLKVRFTKEDKQPLHSLKADKKLLDYLQAHNKPLCSPKQITNRSVPSNSCYILSRQVTN